MSKPAEFKRILYPTKQVKRPVVDREAFEDDEETKALTRNPKFLKMIEESRRSLTEKGGIPLDELKRELADT
jgi:hypothetical protein